MNITHFRENDPNILSDHCLIELTAIFHIENSVNICQREDENLDLSGQDPCTKIDDDITFKYTWDSDKKESYLEQLDTS